MRAFCHVLKNPIFQNVRDQAREAPRGYAVAPAQALPYSCDSFMPTGGSLPPSCTLARDWARGGQEAPPALLRSGSGSGAD